MAQKKKLSETDIRGQIKEYLQWNGWFVYYNLQGLGCYPGLSDLVAIKNGKVVHLEIKKPAGRQSQKQKMFQENIERHGGVYEVARSLEDAQRIDQFYGKGVG